MKLTLDRRDLLSAALLGLLFCLLALQTAHGAEVPISLSGDNPLLPSQVAPGGRVTFSLADSAAASGADLQWYFNEEPIPHATASTLLLSDLTPASTGNYRLKLTDSRGTSRWSTTLPLNVVAPPTSPADRTFTASFPVGVSGVRPRFALDDGSVIVTEQLVPSGSRYARLLRSGLRDASFNIPASAGSILAADRHFVITALAPFLLTLEGIPSPLTLPASFDTSQPLTAAAMLSDGRFFLAQAGRLARFNAGGTLDSSFFDPRPSGDPIAWMRVDLQGRLLVARQTASGSKKIERLTVSGTADSGFVPPSDLPWLFPTRFDDCTDLVPLRSGGYLAVQSSVAVFRLNDDGSLNYTWGLFAATTFPPRAFEFQVAPTVDGVVLVSTILGRGSLTRYVTYVGLLLPDRTFYSGTNTNPLGNLLAIDSLLATSGGELYAGGNFTAWEGHPTQFLARLQPTLSAKPAPSATITVDQSPLGAKVLAGNPVYLGANVHGIEVTRYEWLSLDGQPPLENPSTPLPTIARFTAAHAGRYQLRTTGPGGIALSNVLTLSLDADPVYLANISGRAVAGTGENAVSAGFVTPAATRVLLRGVGPALGPLGVARPLAAPFLRVSSGGVVDASTHTAEVRALGHRLGAFPLPSDSLDAAGEVDVAAGPTTATLSSRDASATGVALAEIYATSPDDAPLNLSFRARTAPGDDTVIAGFVLDDPGEASPPAHVLLRAVGPSLVSQGVTRPLADPVLTVYDSVGRVVAQNDNWPSHLTAEYTAFDAATDKVGAFPLLPSSKDAALLLELPAGAYSMHATGGTGVVLLEIYLVR